MNDKQYEKLKKGFVLDKDTIEDYSWDIDFLVKFKDKNNKQRFVDYMNLTNERAFQKFFDKFVEIIDKYYIKITEMPTAKELFESMKRRIKEHEDSINNYKIDIVKLKKEKQRESDYDKLKELETKIFWAEQSLEDHKKEIYFFDSLKEKIVWDIKYNETRKKMKKKSNKKE